MEKINLLKRHSGWLTRLGLLALASWLTALSCNSFIGSQLAPYTVPQIPDLSVQTQTETETGTKKRTPLSAPVSWVDTISNRCLFGCVEPPTPISTCPEEGCPLGQLCQEGACVADLNAVSGPLDEDVAAPSELNLKLIGVMVAKKSQWSTALLEDPSTKATYIVYPGDQILGDTVVREVKRDRIIFERNGRVEFIRLAEAIAGNPAAPNVSPGGPRAANTPLPKSVPPATAEPVNTPAVAGVQRINPNDFAVDRKSLDAQLSNKAALAQGATIVPNYKDGKKSGLKLVNVNSGSVYQKLGLQGGDVLQSVNGEPIRSQAHAMELMEKFRQADNVSIEVERRGRNEKINYNIR